jgi:hypothetical protein
LERGADFAPPPQSFDVSGQDVVADLRNVGPFLRYAPQGKVQKVLRNAEHNLDTKQIVLIVQGLTKSRMGTEFMLQETKHVKKGEHKNLRTWKMEVNTIAGIPVNKLQSTWIDRNAHQGELPGQAGQLADSITNQTRAFWFE